MKNLLGLIVLASFMLTTSCKQSEGEKAVVSEAVEVATAAGTYISVDTDASVISWEGTKPTGTHNGTINITQGSVTVDNGKVAGGSFVIDMNSISNTDMEGDMKANIENHLKGLAEGKEDHFFNVAQYPTGSFEISKVVSLSGDADANSSIYGNLTLRGITKAIGFKAMVSVNGERVTVSTPKFTINRTNWGINYGSKSVFDDLGDKFINDDIGLTINLTAGKAMM